MKECKKHGLVKFGKNNRCSQCNNERVYNRKLAIKLQSIKYKGGKCEKCGYDKCMAALEFHHLDPTQKEFGIAQHGFSRSWKRVKKELDKCVLICSNCHRELHWEEKADLRKYKTDDKYLIEIDDNLQKDKICSNCGATYNKQNSKFCSQKCSSFNQRKVKRPSKEELEKIIWEKPLIKIAKEFGVSDNAVIKWCKIYNIERPKQGFWLKK